MSQEIINVGVPNELLIAILSILKDFYRKFIEHEEKYLREAYSEGGWALKNHE